jgi:hypothetical protein
MSSEKKDGPRGLGSPNEARRRATWPGPATVDDAGTLRVLSLKGNNSALRIADDNWLARWKRKSAAGYNPYDKPAK